MASRRFTLLLVLATLIGPMAGFWAARRLAPQPPARLLQMRSEPVPIGPVETKVVGATLELALAALGESQGLALNEAIVTIASSFVGYPYAAFPLDGALRERLRLDLTGFNGMALVNQVLALAHSRGAQTRQELLGRVAPHLRLLRYEAGQVDFCQRHHYFSLWAKAAEAQGYGVQLTRFLPGAQQRQRALDYMSRHANSYGPMQDPRQRQCIEELEKQLTVQQWWVPFEEMAPALAALRQGDIVAVATEIDGLDVTDVGIVIRDRHHRPGLIHAVPADGVIANIDLARYAASLRQGLGLVVFRPTPKR